MRCLQRPEFGAFLGERIKRTLFRGEKLIDWLAEPAGNIKLHLSIGPAWLIGGPV